MFLSTDFIIYVISGSVSLCVCVWHLLSFPGDSDDKESACNAGDVFIEVSWFTILWYFQSHSKAIQFIYIYKYIYILFEIHLHYV